MAVESTGEALECLTDAQRWLREVYRWAAVRPKAVFRPGRERQALYARALIEAVRDRRNWEIADGSLTPTMKIKRSALEQRCSVRAQKLGAGGLVV